jgi:hypothetical protein
MSKGFFDALKTTLDGQLTRLNGAIVEYDYNYKVPRRRFYRGGFTISGLQTLLWHSSFSISCNVALGEPQKMAVSNLPVTGDPS